VGKERMITDMPEINLTSVQNEIVACLKLDEHLLAEALRADAARAEEFLRMARTENASFLRSLDAGGRFSDDLAIKLLNNMLKLRRTTEMTYFAKHLPFIERIRRNLFLMHPSRLFRFIKQGAEMLIIEDRVIACVGRQLLALVSPDDALLKLDDRQLTRAIVTASDLPRMLGGRRLI